MSVARCALGILTGLAAALALAAGPANVLGTWTLTEQYYESGRHNHHGPEDELNLDFRLEGGSLAGTVAWSGQRAPWPAYPGPERAAPIEQIVVEFAPDLEAMTARYRVLPPPGDDTTLIVEERWRLEGPDRLLCEVVIGFERGGRQKGGFTWHRVFTRGISR